MLVIANSMVKSKDGKTEIISKEENYFRNALTTTEELIFTAEQNLILNREILEILKKKVKEFKS